MSEKKVTVRQEGKEDKVIDAPEGAVFLQVLKMNGYSLVCCNGKGTCGRCRIRFCRNGAPLPGAADRIAFTAEFVESRQVEAVTAYKGGITKPA